VYQAHIDQCVQSAFVSDAGCGDLVGCPQVSGLCFKDRHHIYLLAFGLLHQRGATEEWKARVKQTVVRRSSAEGRCHGRSNTQIAAMLEKSFVHRFALPYLGICSASAKSYQECIVISGIA
jgi:hypothetical protein